MWRNISFAGLVLASISLSTGRFRGAEQGEDPIGTLTSLELQYLVRLWEVERLAADQRQQRVQVFENGKQKVRTCCVACHPFVPPASSKEVQPARTEIDWRREVRLMRTYGAEFDEQDVDAIGRYLSVFFEGEYLVWLEKGDAK